jgi:hypothetical protein
VITIHKLPVGSFTFLQCLSGTELLNLSRTPDSFADYIFAPLFDYMRMLDGMQQMLWQRVRVNKWGDFREQTNEGGPIFGLVH